jgi:hypothetical protein
MIASVAEFARYFDGVRRRTWAAVDRIGPELLDWAPRAGEMTCGEIVRHVAGAERFFVSKVVDDRFTGDLEPGRPLDHLATRALLESVHREQMARLAQVSNETLRTPRSTTEASSIATWPRRGWRRRRSSAGGWRT